MEQAESNPDSLRVFTTEKWFVQLGMAARGIACCSKCGASGKIAMQAPAFELPACSRVRGHPQVTHQSAHCGCKTQLGPMKPPSGPIVRTGRFDSNLPTACHG